MSSFPPPSSAAETKSDKGWLPVTAILALFRRCSSSFSASAIGAALAPKRVLELGTYSGYSSISMAAGLPEGGHIDTCEFEETHAEVARRYIGQSPHADRITVHLGPALETIERLEGDFDFVFVDADKENYLNYYEALLPRLADGGLMAIDNTLWSGRVLDDSDDSEGTRAIKAINERIASDDRVTSVMLTVRDGITLARRR